VNSLLLATRPKTLLAVVGPIIIGLSLSRNPIKIEIAFLTLACALLLQIGTNLVNDYYDGIKGVDRDRIGPARALASGLLNAKTLKTAFLVSFLLAALLGIALMFRGGWPITTIGIFSLVTAYAYTGGPFPLSYYGLGEFLALIFFGPVAVFGTTYLQDLSFSWLPIIAGLGPGFLAATLMAVNNLRDRANDSLHGKNTIAVYLGEGKARIFTIALVLAAAIIPFILFAMGASIKTLFASGVLLIFLPMWRKILKDPIDQKLNKTLSKTGLCLFLYSLTFSLGYLL
jgi:1,4-dihydroxy-2-naphthoate polyprenyltransferase